MFQTGGRSFLFSPALTNLVFLLGDVVQWQRQQEVLGANEEAASLFVQQQSTEAAGALQLKPPHAVELLQLWWGDGVVLNSRAGGTWLSLWYCIEQSRVKNYKRNDLRSLMIIMCFYDVFGDYILNKTTWSYQFSVLLITTDKIMGLIKKDP